MQPTVLKELRRHGHDVYDFRNPKDDWRKQYPTSPATGFQWESIDRFWRGWSIWSYLQALKSNQAEVGYNLDFNAMERAEIGVLLLPSGKSAHLEAGYFAGHPDKSLHILMPIAPKDMDPVFDEGVLSTQWDAELMYKMADGIHTSVEELLEALRG